jgi:bifunctional UDP-N-acetylglucosamine pyrophosphorylase/glucosamine-1-phosphate N-acetyltransferase
VIGERVQVGSDTTLVAPVRIGDDAYIATATTVRDDVSEGALAFNPRQQRERAGWVAGFRARKIGTTTVPPATKPRPARSRPTPATKKRASVRRKRRAR